MYIPYTVVEWGRITAINTPTWKEEEQKSQSSK